MSSLPKFTELQQKIVIRKLIEMDSHRVIAQYLQHASPEFKPPDMDQEEYEQAVIKRCKDYVSNKNRKWYQIIQEGREKFKEELIRWSIHELMRASFVADSFPHQDAMQSINIKDATEIADMVWELTDRIYTPIYGERDNPSWLNPTKVGVGRIRARMMEDEPMVRRGHKWSGDCDADNTEKADSESPEIPRSVPTADSEHLIEG